jgi:hypothetical protein
MALWNDPEIAVGVKDRHAPGVRAGSARNWLISIIRAQIIDIGSSAFSTNIR